MVFKNTRIWSLFHISPRNHTPSSVVSHSFIRYLLRATHIHSLSIHGNTTFYLLSLGQVRSFGEPVIDIMNPLSILLFAVAVSASAAANMGPPKPQKTLSPSVLSDCGCDGFVNIVQKCQTLDPLSFDEARDCICDRSAGWYGGSMGCRDCLALATTGETTSDEQLFYEAFSTAITNIFVACTNAGASVKVVDEDNGQGICGWHSFSKWACVGFDAEKEEGWASSKEIVVGTAGVEIDEVEDTKSTKTSSVAKPSGASATAAAASASASGVAAANSTSANATASGAPQETHDPNGAAGLKSSLALVGVVALLIAAF